MIHFFKKAIKDIKANFFLNIVTIITIAMAVLIFSSFALFFINADTMLKKWIQDMRIMAYLNPGLNDKKILEIKQKIKQISGTGRIRFISKNEALKTFKEQLGTMKSLAEGLKENPLPDAFEIHMAVLPKNWENIEPAAKKISAIEDVYEVEYGKKWLGKFINFFNLFTLTGYAMGALFFMAAVFFVANTIRLVLYSRKQEIEIMRLVGASDSFIKDPFYIQSLIMGTLGGILGLAALFGLTRLISLNLSISKNFLNILFLPPQILLGILAGSIFVGWLGCFISLRQFLKS